MASDLETIADRLWAVKDECGRPVLKAPVQPTKASILAAIEALESELIAAYENQYGDNL